MLCHASCVSLGLNGVLITGRSGSGKSGLALELMAYGAQLVADDQTEVILVDGWPVAQAPATTKGLIEARGIGLLQAEVQITTRIILVVDLDQIETERLPPDRTTLVLDHPIALLHNCETPYFSAGILQYLKGGKANR